MRWFVLMLAVFGVVTSAAALREHYRTGTSPCSINDRWDCGVVNHSRYAVLAGVPVAAIGVSGYSLLTVLAFRKAWRALLLAAMFGLAFSLYLTQIEARVLEVWCILCVLSLGWISLINVSVLLRMVWPQSKQQT